MVADKKPAKRRGAPRGKRKSAKSAIKFVAPKIDLAFVEKLITESPLESIETKRLLIGQIVLVRKAENLLEQRMAANEITGDEVRALSALTSNMLRFLKELGTLGKFEDDEVDL